ncbi:MAG TPA: hypothetical protein VH020_16140 [Stellaceae bacterium]|nr:hypothetical protein [Stellaceae bacterium]
MTKTMTAALVALALAGGSLAVVPAKADSVTVTSTTGPVFGYSDGYWDRGHAWHAWDNHDAMVTYQRTHHDHFYDSVHTTAPDMGWRTHDMYWETH